MTTDSELMARLDLSSVASAADWAAKELHYQGHAVVNLEPGDATRYRIVIIAAGALAYIGNQRETRDHAAPLRHYLVCLATNFGSSYEWDGTPVDPGYAGSKWAVRFEHHTGVVMSAFLTSLSHHLLPGGQ